MYTVLRKVLSNALIVLFAFSMTFQAAVAEEQLPSDEAPQASVQAEEAPADHDTAPQPSEEAQPEATASAEAQQPSAEPEAQATLEPIPAEEPELVEIQDEQVPLAGAPEPGILIFANRDLTNLHIGDTLTLTCELTGFEGMDSTVRWQALVNGQWKDIPDEHSIKLVIKINSENANWAYRAAVDAQPVQ